MDKSIIIVAFVSYLDTTLHLFAEIKWTRIFNTNILTIILANHCISTNNQRLRFADFILSGLLDFFCFSINTSRRREKLVFLHTLFLENEEEISEKKYRAMDEVHMPNFSYF